MSITTVRVRAIVLTAIIVALVSGCSISARTSSSPTSHSAAPGSAASSAAADPDLAFTLSAIFTSGGSKAQVTEKIYSPTAEGNAAAVISLDQSSECENWRNNAPASSFLRVIVTTTVAGSSWPSESTIGAGAGSPIVAGTNPAESTAAVAWSGDQHGAQTPCSSFRWIGVPGVATAYVGVGDLTSGASPKTVWTSWGYSLLGQLGEQDLAPGLSYTDCTFTVGPAGEPEPGLTKIEPPSPTGSGSCKVNFAS